MKKLVLFFAIAIVSCSSLFASDWFLVSREDGIDIYVNGEMADDHELWVKYEYTSVKARQEAKQKLDLDKTPCYDQTLYVFNRNYTAAAIKAGVCYDKDGKVLFRFNEEYPEMQSIVPDTKGETFAKIAKCIAGEGSNKARERYEYVPFTPERLAALLSEIGKSTLVVYEATVEPGFICVNVKSDTDSAITEENKNILVKYFNETTLSNDPVRNAFVEAFCGMKLYMRGPKKSLSALVANYSTIKRRNEE